MRDEKERIRRKFVRTCNSLREILRDCKKIWPEAELYLNEDTLHLMKGQSHFDDRKMRAQQENSLWSETIHGIGGGAW